jgi:hypothetical protein
MLRSNQLHSRMMTPPVMDHVHSRFFDSMPKTGVHPRHNQTAAPAVGQHRYVFHVAFATATRLASPGYGPCEMTYGVLALPHLSPSSIRYSENPDRHLHRGLLVVCRQRKLVDTHPSVGARESRDVHRRLERAPQREHRVTVDRMLLPVRSLYRKIPKMSAACG